MRCGPFCVRMSHRTAMNLKLIGAALAATTIFAQQTPPPSKLWHMIKEQLIGPVGDRYFKQNVENADLPGVGRFDGKVVSQTSAHELIVNVDDPAGDAR